jgi:hypothetical protein
MLDSMNICGTDIGNDGDVGHKVEVDQKWEKLIQIEQVVVGDHQNILDQGEFVCSKGNKCETSIWKRSNTY